MSQLPPSPQLLSTSPITATIATAMAHQPFLPHPPQCHLEEHPLLMQDIISVSDSFPDLLYSSPSKLADTSLVVSGSPPHQVPDVCYGMSEPYHTAGPAPAGHHHQEAAGHALHQAPQELWSLSHMSEALQDTQVFMNVPQQPLQQETHPHLSLSTQQQEAFVSPQQPGDYLPQVSLQQEGNHFPSLSPQQTGGHSPLQHTSFHIATPSPQQVSEHTSPSSPQQASPRLTPSPPQQGANRRARRTPKAKRPKLYERMEKFQNPADEKRRLDAINSKKNRDNKKATLAMLRQRVLDYTSQRDVLQQEVEGLKKREVLLLQHLKRCVPPTNTTTTSLN